MALGLFNFLNFGVQASSSGLLARLRGTTVIPNNDDQARVSDFDGQRFVVGRGDASEVDGAPVLTIDDDRVSLRNAGRLATEGETATVQVDGDRASITNRRSGAIEAEDTAIEINGDRAHVSNQRGALVDGGQNGIEVNGEDAHVNNAGLIVGGFNGVNFAFEGETDSFLFNRGTILSDSRAVNIDGDGVRVVNRGDIRGTGDQRNGTIYADASANNYEIENDGRVDAGNGNQGAGISLQLGESVDAEVQNDGVIQGRGQAAASSNLAGDGIRLFSGVEGSSTFTGQIRNRGSIDSESDQGTTAGLRVAEGVNFQGRLVNERNGVISGDQNGVYFGNDNHEDGLFVNRGRVSSDSRAVNLDGDGLTFVNQGLVLGTDNQRNGTVYLDGTADDTDVRNHGTIDAGEGNLGDGISVQVGSSSEDALNENIVVHNSGEIQGRGQAAFENGARVASNGSSGVRFFNGSGEPEATVSGSVTNSGTITTEVDVGFLGGLVVEDGVGFDGTITNDRRGVISGPRNGLYVGNAEHNLTIENEGRIESGSRVVNLDGDNVTFNNHGDVVGTGNQRNGTLYVDGTADDVTITNSRRGDIDAGAGNLGDGIAVQVGSSSEDALNENIVIDNSGEIQGRSQAAFENGARAAANGSSGVRFFNGSGEPQATVSGSVTNSGTITTEVNVGFLGGLVVEDGVGFDGTITNEARGVISGPRNGLYIGNAEHDLTVDNFGRIESGSRAVNLDGDFVTFNNHGEVIGVGDQRNGTLYLDGTADNVTVTNGRHGEIDAGRGNDGSGVSVQVGSSSEDALNENITLENDGLIQGRGDGNVPAGVRFFNGSGEDVATVTGSISNGEHGTIASETAAGILIEDGVAFNGTITNAGVIRGGNGVAIDAGGSEGDITLNQNGGEIDGDVRLGSGADVVNVNDGVIDGDLDTGDGADVVTLGDDGSVTGSISGGAGNDLLNAGNDADTFLFETGTGQDRVAQFSTSEDRLDVSDFGFADFAAVQAAATEAVVDGQTSTVIDLDGAAGADQVTLLGVALADLSASNVILQDEQNGV